MTNNDILKKLRVALQLRDDQIVEILELVDFRVSKGEIGNFFRSEDHPKYVECKDQILRNFLNGLVIYLRGTKENPKNPREVLEQNKYQMTINPLQKVGTINSEKRLSDNSKTKQSKKINPYNAIKFNNGKRNKKAED